MNEVITLSTDINVITAEIKSYQQIAGHSIFEIGMRLKHVKENDLVHGEWTRWLETIGMQPRNAQRLMQVTMEFEGNTNALSHLGFTKLLQITQLPENIDKQQFIEEVHTIPTTGEEKTVENMTTREFEEVKKALKEKDKLLHQETERRKRAEQEAFAVRKSEQLTRKQLEEFEQQEPQIIEKEVVKEVAIESKEHINLINELKDKNAELKDTVDFYKQKADALSKNVDDIQLEESSLNYVANKNVHNLIAYMDDFLKDAVVSSLMRGSIATASDATKELLDSRIEAFQEFLNDLKIAKTGRKMN
ncbi:DUF3102 domain-containing protein [Bacillus cereus]|uniref:DUF3102 domain-containing protein n=1 Tax=Bacillus cereus TaxID=1396 RepID=A0AAW5KXB6_BACCE|nr:DUF3102 domain-containing protein [Bacillus cereus]MCQ6284871.1 DUF3102 domain-containing protein [Bacillus cereus]MCQ6305929.1 DUF3102 domain-containing protein [Bacillus cereus]MCQ6313967.1 DUF3102 domain-containing protein [Bacillus cereus]MCQ6330326.1 DUF3102 domain-containing protein [Bacillus cereus]MCQ6381853.1 DUF3102 domain-containing protein [Bacillus cereus]